MDEQDNMPNPKTKALNPIIYEKTQNGEEMYDVFSRLMKERILFIGEDITSDLANCIISQLLWLDKQNQDEEISIYINSCGGDLLSMFAIYDIMQHIKAPVYTFVIGTAASAAAVLLCAGQKEHRYSMPSAEIMIHQPSSYGLEGQVTDISLNARQMERGKKKMLTILARHTGKPYEQVERDCERDFYMDPPMAIKYGLIDAITTPNKELPQVTHESRFRKKWTKK